MKQFLRIFKIPSCIVTILAVACLPSLALATGPNPSIGDLAGNLFDIGLDVRAIVQAVCIIAGSSLILGSLLQYKKYRQNPIETRLSTAIFTLVIGIILLLLSLIPMQS